jgi:tetratricopeptide (TPR) repeat protein
MKENKNKILLVLKAEFLNIFSLICYTFHMDRISIYVLGTAINILEKIDDKNSFLVRYYINFADICFKRIHNNTVAEICYKKAMDILEKGSPNHKKLERIYNNYASICNDLGKSKVAINTLKKGIVMLEKVKPKSELLANYYMNCGDLYTFKLNNNMTANLYYKKADQIAKGLLNWGAFSYHNYSSSGNLNPLSSLILVATLVGTSS